MATIRISVPQSAAAGEIITIRALIMHPMESGYRRDPRGAAIPRDIITAFECRYDGEIVFRADLSSGIAANPFFEFSTTATRSGALSFVWRDQSGATWTETAHMAVA